MEPKNKIGLIAFIFAIIAISASAETIYDAITCTNCILDNPTFINFTFQSNLSDNGKVDKSGSLFDGKFYQNHSSISAYFYWIFDKNGTGMYQHNQFGENLIVQFNASEMTNYLPINMNTGNIFNLADPIDNQDAATKNYVDTNDNLKRNLTDNNFTTDVKLSSIPSSVLSFDGVDDYVDNGNNFNTLTNSYTFSLWYNPYNLSIPNGQQLFGKRAQSTSTEDGYGIFVYATGLMRTYFGNGTVGSDTNNINVGGFNIGTSYLITYIINREQGLKQLYINGIIKSNISFLILGSQNNSNTFKIGKGTIGINQLNGSIDEVRIYNRALSASEISNLYNGTYVNSSGLVLNMNMNEEQGNKTYDSSGYDNHGTIMGANWSYSYMPLKYNNDIYINKSGTIMMK